MVDKCREECVLDAVGSRTVKGCCVWDGMDLDMGCDGEGIVAEVTGDADLRGFNHGG